MTLKEFRKYRMDADAEATTAERTNARRVARAFIEENRELFDLLENL